MKICISKGNMKLGKIANISLAPILSCDKKVECSKDCYALKAYRLYPNVKKAWADNLKIYRKDPDLYFNTIDKFLSNGKTSFFRWQQAGDIYDQAYYNRMVEIAKKYKDIKFLVFTKKYHLDFSTKPDNLEIVFSAWPGRDIPKTKFKIAWMNDGIENRIPNNAIECPGNCESCGMCWNLSKLNKDVYFNKH